MTGYAVQCWIPVVDLGRLRMPTQRLRFQDGWIRLGRSPAKNYLIATLEDREGQLLPKPTHLEACAHAVRLGQALAYYLTKTNRYESGEDPRGAAIQVAI